MDNRIFRAYKVALQNKDGNKTLVSFWVECKLPVLKLFPFLFSTKQLIDFSSSKS